MECNHCKKEIPADSKFCVHCGKKIEKFEAKEAIKERGSVVVPKSISDMRNHLEFVGYELNEVTADEDNIQRFLATHKNRSNLFVSYFPQADVITFLAYYSMPEVASEAKKHRLLEFINKINNLNLITALTVGDDYKSITCASWCHNSYSKKDFSNFIEIFENEIASRFRLEEFQEFLND